MVPVFVDTSAFLALMVPEDPKHARALRTYSALQGRAAVLVSTSYVLSEIYSLLDRRTGRDIVVSFRREMEPLVDVAWVGAEDHHAGLDLLETRPRSVSFVDAVSCVVARRLGIREVFAYDPHFRREGFTVL